MLHIHLDYELEIEGKFGSNIVEYTSIFLHSDWLIVLVVLQAIDLILV